MPNLSRVQYSTHYLNCEFSRNLSCISYVIQGIYTLYRHTQIGNGNIELASEQTLQRCSKAGVLAIVVRMYVVLLQA